MQRPGTDVIPILFYTAKGIQGLSIANVYQAMSFPSPLLIWTISFGPYFHHFTIPYDCQNFIIEFPEKQVQSAVIINMTTDQEGGSFVIHMVRTFYAGFKRRILHF